MTIDQGRKWLDTDGLEHDGRLSYRLGLTQAMEAFQNAADKADTDLEMLILAEYTFLTQELSFTDAKDTRASASLSKAIRSFDDAFRALKAVGDPVVYNGAELTHPRDVQYRVKEMPKDAFHVACISHRTRIQNSLSTPGVNMAEKDLLMLRSANMTIAQAAYIKKQKTALAAAPAETTAQDSGNPGE